MDPRPLTVTLEPEATQPAHCAGLREALQYRWRHGFPLQDSPFLVLGRELGATPREVMGHCHLLRDKGVLDAIRVQWGAALHRERRRCGLTLAGPPGPSLAAALRALPGVSGWDWVETDRHARGHLDEPTLWFDVVARDAVSADV